MRHRAFSLALALAAACSANLGNPGAPRPSSPGPTVVNPGPQRPSDPDPPLSPGDVLRITVWRAPEFSGEFVVAPDGTLLHPLYQGVKVGGIRVSMVKSRLRTFLTAYEQNPQLVVEPLFPVTVAGEVRLPSLYIMPQGTTIAQAIARAGGPTERGRLDRVRLLRQGQEMMIDALAAQQQYAATPISSGDQLFVGRRSDFNLLRDALGPVFSLAAAAAGIIVAVRQ